jgi:hypothetical protein
VRIEKLIRVDWRHDAKPLKESPGGLVGRHSAARQTPQKAHAFHRAVHRRQGVTAMPDTTLVMLWSTLPGCAQIEPSAWVM